MQFLNFGNGSDGVLNVVTSTQNPIDAPMTGVSGENTVSATNPSFAIGQMVLLHQSRGANTGRWQVNKIVDYEPGIVTLEQPLDFDFVSLSQIIVIPQYSQVNVTGTFSAKAWNGSVGGVLAYLCNGLTNVTGSISANGKGFRGGSAVIGGQAWSGEGTGGASVLQRTENGTGGGGGQGDSGNRGPGGGGGGYATAGVTGDPSNGNLGGVGGTTYGNEALTTLMLGGGGGGGARGAGVQGTPGSGSNGGGIVLAFSKEFYINPTTGSITADGLAGVNASGAEQSGGGGGGSGGSVFLKGQILSLGTNRVTANGGSGGIGLQSVDGGAGGTGRVRTEGCRITGNANSPTPSKAEGGFNFCGSLASIIG